MKSLRKPTTADEEVQSIAEMVFRSIRTLPTTQEGAMALALAHTALIWQLNPKDEAEVRAMMAQTTEAVVVIWHAQGAAKGAPN